MENNNMENNNETRPRKKVTKEMLRNRQLGGVVVVCLVILILFIIIANSCSNSGDGKKDDEKAKNTTTTSAVTTTAVPLTTAPLTTTNPLAAQVQIDMTEVYLNEGEMKMPFISGYPENTSEANEVWTSLDPTIATVDNYGHITGVARGETFVILSFNNLPGVEVQIRVSVADTSAGSDIGVPSLSSSDEMGIGTDTYTTTAPAFTG